jgi:hypothetical protein
MSIPDLNIPDWLDNHIHEPTEPAPKKRGSPRWHKGMKSPNPNGRPKGLKDRRLSLTTTMVENAHEVLAVVVEKALDGDMQAAGLLLNRCSPTLKPQALPVQFELNLQGSATEQAAQVLEAIATGELPPDTGNQIIDSMSKIYGIKQIDELEQRIALLEGRG